MATRTRINFWRPDGGWGRAFVVEGTRKGSVFIHHSVVAPRPIRGADLTDQEIVVDGVNWEAAKGPRALAVYSLEEWDKREAARRAAAEAEARRKAEMPMEWSYSNEIGKRERRPACYVADPNGDVFRFNGQNISGVVEVITSQYTKMGKWSHTTWQCASPKGTAVVSWLQSWEEGLFWPQGTWEEAIAWFQSEAPQAKPEAIEAMIRKDFAKAAERFDANRAALAESRTTGEPVEWVSVAGAQRAVDLVVTPTGEVYVFADTDIPGVVKVLRQEYLKKGKWSTTTSFCVSPAGTTIVRIAEDDRGRSWPQTTWEEAVAWLRTQAPQARPEAVESLIRERFPGDAERLDAEHERLAEGRRRLTLEFSYKVGCAPADPEMAKWGIDGNIVPCEEIDSGKGARAPNQRTEVVYAPVRALAPGEFLAVRSWRSGGAGFDEVAFYDHNLNEVKVVAVEDLKEARANAALVASGNAPAELERARRELAQVQRDIRTLRQRMHGKPSGPFRAEEIGLVDRQSDLDSKIRRLEGLTG